MSRQWDAAQDGVRAADYHPRRSGRPQPRGRGLAALIVEWPAWRRREHGVGMGPLELPPRAGEVVAELQARPSLLAATGLFAAFALALAIRVLFLGTAYDLHVDEVTYFFISQAVATGHGLTLHGQPFFLHPPLFFLVEAPYILLTHPTGLILQQTLDMRLLDAVFGAATAVVLLLLAARVGGWRIALATFLLFTLDPFIVRMNSRNLIESLALLLVMLGYLALLWGPVERGRVGMVRLVAVGLCFGAALLTKEMTFFLTLLPVGLLFLTGWVLPRRTALGIVVVAAVVYALYPLGVALSGLGPLFIEEKLSGLLRFLGVMKTTGFVKGGPSFTTAIVRNLDIFATTYALLGLGIPASILLAWKGDARRRVIGVVGVSAYALLAYSIAFGTLEEQFFYFLVLPTILSVPLAWSFAMRLERRLRPADVRTLIGQRMDLGSLAHRGVEAGRVVLPVALAVSLGWSCFVWLQVRLTPDDGYRQLEAYLRAHVAQGTAIGVTTDPQQFILQGYVIRPVASRPALLTSHVRYAVISTKQIEDGYTKNGTEIYSWLRSHADPVYVFDGRTYGRLEVYRIPIVAGGSSGG